MKTTKMMISMMVVYLFVFFPGHVFAQTDLENHAQFSKNNKSIMQHTNAIASGEAKTKNDQISHYNEARKSFIEAKKANNLLKKGISENLKSEAVVHHDKIDKNYSAALPFVNSMLEELKNGNTDNARLKEQAKKLHDYIDLAEKEHQVLIKETH
ncbi:MAG: hypothetical protein GZ094_03200 [Mariniphaga sp.]|nr:hypothetical protein [Mariniphaga sp.]